MPRTRPAYLDEFRQEAVAMVRGGRLVRDVAESLGVFQQSLRRWVKQTELVARVLDRVTYPNSSEFYAAIASARSVLSRPGTQLSGPEAEPHFG